MLGKRPLLEVTWRQIGLGGLGLDETGTAMVGNLELGLRVRG